ncbi:MAG TPA: hypothetical protein PLB05_01800 [Candidatus Omnitrophota bacterium]|jgi:hypothetical protein|nr:hypothetical protein [Candidatus Omnitrophota bacterium]
MEQNILDILLRPAIKGGILDSVNPGSMASWLLLVVVMVLAQRKFGKMVPCGSLFVLGLLVARGVVVTGFLDKWLLSHWFEVLLEVWYFIFALTCLTAGGLFWRDWRLSSRKDSPRKAILSEEWLLGPADWPPSVPFFKRKKKWRWFFTVIELGVLSFWLGCLAAMLATAWPEDGYFVAIFLSMGASQNFGKMFIMVGCYAFFYVLPLVFVFLLTWLAFGRKQLVDVLRARYSLVQVIGAAVFLGYGISFFSYYLN